ncbi:MAG: peptidylprolyl isomerase [Lachnospiraceae bacterium]|nr:peptidylprolyl isomerase [Lachnospiraceae bacterium]
MKTAFIASLIALSAAMPAMAITSDKTIMTIAGKEIPVSEFEYFYHKSNGQQAKPISPEEYAELFSVYKLKVADAQAAGVDTTSAFKSEFDKYCHELIQPYLRVQSVEDSLVNVAYNHMLTDREVSHIMLDKGNTPQEEQAARATLDSIRTAILNGADFKELALKYSIDGSVKYNGGTLGIMPVGRLPYSFEEAAYDTPVGSLSGAVETPFGLHLIRVDSEHKNVGEVQAQHILILTQGKSPEEQELAKAKIDSIYNVIVAGGDFSALAKQYSEDPGSASEGGMLPWFGKGMMVPEFETTSFTLNDGEISKPFSTSYGYHIVKRLAHRDVRPLAEVRDQIIETMKRDGRYNEAEKAGYERLKKRYNALVFTPEIDGIKAEINRKGVLDSVMCAALVSSPVTIGEVAKKKITTADILAEGLPAASLDSDEASEFIDYAMRKVIEERLIDAEIARLVDTDANFRNLYNEYRDGMMLFEVANREVWSKAAADEDGLKRYFEEHKSKYTWASPKFKGYVVYSRNDSVGAEFAKYLETEHPSIDTLANVIDTRFDKQIRMERVLAAKGDDKVVDAVVFKSGDASAKGPWEYVTLYQGRVIDAPEEMSDVRGAVISDYQNLLEKQWVERLKGEYPIKVDKKLLKKVQ